MLQTEDSPIQSSLALVAQTQLPSGVAHLPIEPLRPSNDDEEEYEDVLKKYRNVDLNESKDDVYVDALMTPEKTGRDTRAECVVLDLRAVGAVLFTLFTNRDIPEHFREIREGTLMDTLGAFVDVNDSNLEIDTREEMRVLLDAMDGSNEIPEDMRDLIEKLSLIHI